MKRELPPFHLRLPSELKELLAKEAERSGRSLNSQILNMLQRQLDELGLAQSRGYAKASESSPPEYSIRNDSERDVLRIFRKMSAEKQLALLSLFK